MKVLSQLLATFLTNAWLIVGSFLLGSLAVVTGIASSTSRIPYLTARWWGSSLVWCAGVKIERDSECDLDPEGTYVFFANHQSLYDIPALLKTLPVDARFLTKQSLFRLPIFGFALKKAGFVPVDRGAGTGAAKAAFRAASEHLEAGRSILLFPEETRSQSGEILPFKVGGVLIALRAGVPIVPVGVYGTKAVRPKGSVLVRPGTVSVRYGEPVDPSSFGVRGKRQAVEHLRKEVSRLSGEPLKG